MEILRADGKGFPMALEMEGGLVDYLVDPMGSQRETWRDFEREAEMAHRLEVCWEHLMVDWKERCWV